MVLLSYLDNYMTYLRRLSILISLLKIILDGCFIFNEFYKKNLNVNIDEDDDYLVIEIE